MSPLLLAGLGYLVGSIPFSFMVARLFGVKDVRTVGSGNVGATNVMRSAGKTGATSKKVELFIIAFFILTLWGVAVINPSILGMIESLGGPIIATILFLMPMYAIKRPRRS